MEFASKLFFLLTYVLICHACDEHTTSFHSTPSTHLTKRADSLVSKACNPHNVDYTSFPRDYAEGIINSACASATVADGFDFTHVDGSVASPLLTGLNISGTIATHRGINGSSVCHEGSTPAMSGQDCVDYFLQAMDDCECPISRSANPQ